MSNNKTESLTALKKLIREAPRDVRDWGEFLTGRGGEVRDLAIGWAYGNMLQVGKFSDGELHVQFVANSGSTAQGWSGPWPQWAFDLAYDALLHNKQVFLMCNGNLPTDTDLLDLQVFSYAAS